MSGEQEDLKELRENFGVINEMTEEEAFKLNQKYLKWESSGISLKKLKPGAAYIDSEGSVYTVAEMIGYALKCLKDKEFIEDYPALKKNK